MRIKTGDNVVVISGKDKGVQGTVLRTFPKTDRLIVENVAMMKKHMKATQANQESGIVEQEGTIHISNVMLIDPKTNQPTKIGYKVVDGKKERYAKKSGEVLN